MRLSDDLRNLLFDRLHIRRSIVPLRSIDAFQRYVVLQVLRYQFVINSFNFLFLLSDPLLFKCLHLSINKINRLIVQSNQVFSSSLYLIPRRHILILCISKILLKLLFLFPKTCYLLLCICLTVFGKNNTLKLCKRSLDRLLHLIEVTGYLCTFLCNYCYCIVHVSIPPRILYNYLSASHEGSSWMKNIPVPQMS